MIKGKSCLSFLSNVIKHLFLALYVTFTAHSLVVKI